MDNAEMTREQSASFGIETPKQSARSDENEDIYKARSEARFSSIDVVKVKQKVRREKLEQMDDERLVKRI